MSIEERINVTWKEINGIILSDNSIDYVKDRLLFDLEQGEKDIVSEYLDKLDELIINYKSFCRNIDWTAEIWDQKTKETVDSWDKKYDELCSEIINR